MSEHNGAKLSQRLHACVQDIWPRYLTHPFVTQMADGTLPAEKFRYYMLQDYLYLKDYVKIFAAILQKADDFEQIRFLSEELANTIDETFRTHLPYMQRLGVTDDEIRHKFEKAWGVSLPAHVCRHLSYVRDKVLREPDPKKRIHAYYIIGEDPAQSDPDLPEIRRTLSAIDLVIVQDIFFNKTCEYADVIFPATAWGEHNAVYTSCDRRFQRVRKLIEPQPGCKTDWEILCLMATAMGYPMHYDNTEQIWDEMRSLCPKFAGASYEKMVENHGVQWPCTEDSPDDTGTQYLHKGAHFATADGKGHFYYYPWTPAKELESPEYPLSLSTVREVGHYSVRTMTGNCRLLADLADEPGYIQMNPEDCRELGIANGDLVRVVSKRGHTITRCQETDRVSKGATYMTYQWWVGACNELTSAALDPKSHTPEFKYCACRVEKIDDQKQADAPRHREDEGAVGDGGHLIGQHLQVWLRNGDEDHRIRCT